MNEQIVDELYQLAGGEVPREKIAQSCSSLSPDEAQEWVDTARRTVAENPKLGKYTVCPWVVQECYLKKGQQLLWDEEGKPLPTDEEKIEEALAAFRESFSYLEYVAPQTRCGIYHSMVRAYGLKYGGPSDFPGRGGSLEEQREFIEAWNAFQKYEESWQEWEISEPPTEVARREHEKLMEFKPDFLFQALIRLEGYKDTDEIYEMRERGNPEGAIKEWKKWIPHRELFSVMLSPSVEFFICVEFAGVCSLVYGEPHLHLGNYPNEDLKYAWEAYQSARRIWNEHHEEIWETFGENPPTSKEEYGKVIEQSYQVLKYGVLVRFEGYKPIDEIEGMLESNLKGAVEELKKWFSHKDFFSVADGPAGEFCLYSEFLAACEGAYGTPSNFPDEEFNYAWEAIQSARRIWNAHQQKVIEIMEIPAAELRQLLEQSYQALASERSRRTRRASPQPETQAQPSSGPCFIATVVYGSENAPEVFALRAFRDDVLLPSKLGRALVALYYLLSPPMARLLRANLRLRNIVRRAVVEPIANIVRSKFDADKGE